MATKTDKAVAWTVGLGSLAALIFGFTRQVKAAAPPQIATLIRVQYSASIGGRNEPLGGAYVTVYDVTTGTRRYVAAISTSDEGQTTINVLRSGKTYDIEVAYAGEEKVFTLPYSGESILLISIDPTAMPYPLIVDAVFDTVQPAS